MTAGGIAAAPGRTSRARHRSTRAGAWNRFVGIGSALLSVVLVVAVLAALALAVVPRFLGGSALTVLSGSMEPLYSAGDMVVVVPVDADEIQVGDVVAFQPVSGDPTLITHRVVAESLGGEGGAMFVTRGDANGADDDPIEAEQIMGRALYHVRAAGHVVLWAGDHTRTIVAGAAVVLLVYAAVMLLRPSGRRAAR
ncbi:signal peptidase I [Georgenia faecalis]|uniref:Signal peptidase I n=1 Tax=Georgenia faecalis TaxID=2483799 RepID=A0ABV9D6D6_9MICO|nr:signal peptidase I [Georgenia faecalis]